MNFNNNIIIPIALCLYEGKCPTTVSQYPKTPKSTKAIMYQKSGHQNTVSTSVPASTSVPRSTSVPAKYICTRKNLVPYVINYKL